MATVTYGIRLKITPNTTNTWRAATVVYRAETALGTKTEIARQRGTSVFYVEDVLPSDAGDYFYWVRAESDFYTSSSYVGPVDAEPTDLSTELET